MLLPQQIAAKKCVIIFISTMAEYGWVLIVSFLIYRILVHVTPYEIVYLTDFLHDKAWLLETGKINKVQETPCLTRVYPASYPVTAGIGSSTLVTLNWIKRV